ncbi:MAG: SCO family protein [Gammaproteobacteria bacterium]|nr:SCO family protein [Gammaproteobacteria bacterium]
MRQLLWVATIAIWLLGETCLAKSSTPWGKNYFPNVTLTSHDGKTLRFFDDVIKDKIVAINFIYTHCAESCPLETAQLVQVQKILGERLGKDVFFYSISIDPEQDSPQVLADYRKKFRANWTFLTGNEADIVLIRKKLGLYIPEIQDGSNNHNVNLIIGNQATGRWMKRSPFENPHILADQLVNWLGNWKQKPVINNYATAPELRNIGAGEQLFRTRCASCHSITGQQVAGSIGPDLYAVTELRDKQWLLNWLQAPDQMIKQNDPIATALYEQYNRILMPNMRLSRQETEEVLNYIADETLRIKQTANLARK